MTAGKADMQKIEALFQGLIESCDPYCDQAEIKRIREAYELALDGHGGSRSASGEFNICHSILIAKISSEEIGLGATSVMAALLHDVVNKTDITLAQIKEKFGDTVALLIEEYTKLSNLNTKRIDVNSEKFRNLFMTIVDDIRVILLKLAHRIHDLRTIQDLPESKQAIFIAEIEHVYLPITHRLGLYKVKSELEERLMQYLYPEIFQEITNKITQTKTKRKLFIDEFINPISRELILQGFDCEIIGRPKSIHSVWEKMKKQNVKFEEVFDLFAIRIISNSKPSKEKTDCWKIYSIVTNIYTPNPKRLRDWITTPKASGYESLHTTVQGSNKKWVEVQIRSGRMDEMAEKGQAAHWRYKGFDSAKDSQLWLEQVRDILENPDQLKFDQQKKAVLSAKSKKIFVFTPEGDLKELPRGSSILDFAYEIHTRVGDQCYEARVNNKIVPIRYELQNGDKVEIITSKNQSPKMDWLQFVKTSKAKNKIKRSILEEKYREAQEGNDILRRKLKNWKIQFSDEVIDKLVKHYKFASALDLYSMIAFEKADMNEIRNILLKKDSSEKPSEEMQTSPGEKQKAREEDNFLLIDDKLDNVNYRLAKCCNPIPGDKVFGFVTIGKGITIHRKSCPNAKRMLNKYGYREISVQWKDSVNGAAFQATIRITGEDKIGMLGEITNVISGDLRVNMQSIKVDSKKEAFTGYIKVIVKDSRHLNELVHKLLKINGVTKASRIKK
ncbi:MAG: bifunctional (p)ppGpp synthetase/guanosine-3',5'-bis(diphosphate) 3'-pyrophosphohydrolase [Bacteroidetes bacterium]|nr:bifunctional (p)ppGpp synthetase/guanosine-3',5'-bis(diphosphate) 3'-pyrophosphohydrolase [Bacteroidota bacterium]